MYSVAADEIDAGQVKAAAKKLQNVLVGTLPEGSGYSIKVVPITGDCDTVEPHAWIEER